MKKISSDIIDELVEQKIIEANLDQYGDMSKQIRQATLEELADADVLLHAITDALLGATACGDIGELFPDTDPANKGRDSAEMLRAAADRVAAAGFRVVNLDCVIFAQRPKILPHRPRIRGRIAGILGIDEGAVWLKAKTGEGVGPIGEEQAIAAECVVLLERPPIG